MNSTNCMALHELRLSMLSVCLSSLQCLPITIKKRADVRKASRWVFACVVLHNFTRITSSENMENELAALRRVARAEGEDEVHHDLPEVPEPEEVAVMNERRKGAIKRDQLKLDVLKRAR